MSNSSIMSVREMIENAFGEAEVNSVNFKLIQAILYLLARQLRVLERQVGVEIGFVPGVEETDSTLSVTEVNISATVPKKGKGRGGTLLNKVLTSTPKITQSTMGTGSSVFERMTRISRVSAYDVQTSRKRVEMDEKEGRHSGEKKTARKRRESSSKYTDDESHSSKRGKSESEKDRYGDESDVSDQFEDSRQRGSGKSEQKGRAGGLKGVGHRSDAEETDDVGEMEKSGGTRVTIGGKHKGGSGKHRSEGRTKKSAKGSSSSSSDTSKLKHLQKILNYIEEERERVLRIIQQRTDSKVEGPGSPTPIASMDSMEVQYEKLLILERVPSKEAKSKKGGAGQPRLSIVTQEQFAELVRQVEILEKKFGPASSEKYGENAKLMEELRKGASLTDAMAALQLSARIENAETALQNMIALLTELSKRGPPKQGKPGAPGGTPQTEEEKGAGVQGHKGAMGTADPDAEIDPITGLPISKTKFGRELTDELEEKESLTHVLYEGPDVESQGKRMSLKSKGRSITDQESIAFSDLYGTSGTIAGAIPKTRQEEQQAEGIKKYGNFITPEQLQKAMKGLVDEFNKVMNTVSAKSVFNAENALKICKGIENQLEKSGNLGERMAILEKAVAQYVEQINILDTGLSSQMTNYQEQLTQMQHELEIGLENMAEALAAQGGDSEAVLELNTRLTALQNEFDKSKSMQLDLSDVQAGLGLDLEALWKQIEHLRGVKSDRDEVADALRDKAGIGILNGLVTTNQFEAVRGDIEKRIRSAYDKFNNQEIVWQKAIDDISREINEKAELSHVIALRDDVNKNLDMLRNRIENMLSLLGEPKTNDLTKTIYREEPCLSCATPSPFGLEEPNLAQLPPLKARPPTIGQESPPKRKGEGDHGACYFGQPIPHALDPRARVCTRYCGSSVPTSSKLQKEPPNININTLIRQPTTGVDSDGKPIVMDEKLLRVPCKPCNTTAMLSAVKQQEQQEGDKTVVNEEGDEKTAETVINDSLQNALPSDVVV